MESLEFSKQHESQEKQPPTLVLSFLRHAEREIDENKNDVDIGLTQKGKQQAFDTGESDQLERQVAFSSPRKRAQETAGFVMLAKNVGLEQERDESLEEIQSLLKPASLRIDERLDFAIDVNSEFSKTMVDEYKRGQYLKFLIEDSDALAERLGDSTTLTYKRSAAQIAEIIKDHVAIVPRWDQMVRHANKPNDHVLERVLVSHGGVLESFLARIIEETRGVEVRNAFLGSLNNEGFGYAGGFTAEISIDEDTKNPVVRINYKAAKEGGPQFEFHESVDDALLEKITSIQNEKSA